MGVERKVLGPLIGAPTLLDRRGWLEPEDFLHGESRAVFEAVRALWRWDRLVDQATAAAALGA